jgi:hypothetical protein
MGSVEKWIEENGHLSFYGIGARYELPDIKALGLAPSLDHFVRVTTKGEQRIFARLALAYESAEALRDTSEMAKIAKSIHSFIVPILRKEYRKYWRVKYLDTMLGPKHFLQTQLGMSGLPISKKNNSLIAIKPFLTEEIRDMFADIDMLYRMKKATSKDLSPIETMAHKLLIHLYEEAVPSFKKEQRRLRYGNPNVNSPTLNKINAIYTQRLESIERGSGSRGTKTRKANALRKGKATHFQAPRWAGTKCDKMLGFAQHAGECATDALQQILLFADPWKNKIQPLVYDLTEANIEDLYTDFVAGPPPHPTKSGLKSLLLNMKKRFQNHYTALQILSHEEDCVPPFDYRKLLTEAAAEASFAGISLEQKKKLSGELGPSLKRDLTTLLPGITTTHNHNMQSIFRILFRLFKIPYVVFDIVNIVPEARKWFQTIVYSSPYRENVHLAFYLTSIGYLPNKIALLPPKGEDAFKYTSGAPHATAIYQCDSTWYYYDNNSGIFKLHPRLMEDLLNEVTTEWFIAMGYTTAGLEFFKIPYFNTDNVEVLSTKTVYYWKLNSSVDWQPLSYKFIVDTNIILFKFYGCIHIMTADHRHTGYASPYLQHTYVHGNDTEPQEERGTKKEVRLWNILRREIEEAGEEREETPPNAIRRETSPNTIRRDIKEGAKVFTSPSRGRASKSAPLKNVNATEKALLKRIAALKNVNNTEKALLARIRSMTRKKSRSV